MSATVWETPWRSIERERKTTWNACVAWRVACTLWCKLMRDYQTSPQPPTAPLHRYPCFLRVEASTAATSKWLHASVYVYHNFRCTHGSTTTHPSLPLDAYPRIKPGYTLTPVALIWCNYYTLRDARSTVYRRNYSPFRWLFPARWLIRTTATKVSILRKVEVSNDFMRTVIFTDYLTSRRLIPKCGTCCEYCEVNLILKLWLILEPKFKKLFVLGSVRNRI